MAYFKESSSPVKASSFNPLSPDLLTLYRRLNPIKIWPTYAVPPTTTLCPRSTYDLCRAGSSPTIFQPVEKFIPLTTTSQSGPDQSSLYFRPTNALPDQGPLIADLSIFPKRERAGVDRVSGLNGSLSRLPRPIRAGQITPLYLRPTCALPDQGPLIADPSIFPERERAGFDRVSGVNRT